MGGTGLQIRQREPDEEPFNSSHRSRNQRRRRRRPSLSIRSGLIIPRVPRSMTLGSSNSRFSRGRSRGGASRAARNAFHCSAFNPKRVRSASVSSARTCAFEHGLADGSSRGGCGGLEQLIVGGRSVTHLLIRQHVGDRAIRIEAEKLTERGVEALLERGKIGLQLQEKLPGLRPERKSGPPVEPGQGALGAVVVHREIDDLLSKADDDPFDAVVLHDGRFDDDLVSGLGSDGVPVPKVTRDLPAQRAGRLIPALET